jgi:hypothetical protein
MKLKKDIIVLNLLIGWEIIHFSKKAKKLSLRLREFPEIDSRFLRVTFSKCFVLEFYNFSNTKETDILKFDFSGLTFASVTLEQDEIINIHLLKKSEFVGSLKIVPSEVDFQFTTK